MSNDAQVMTTRRPGRPKAGSEDKKARILAEALTLFSTRGYVATSLADIARAADISKAGLLRIINVIPMASPCTPPCPRRSSMRAIRPTPGSVSI